MSLSSRSLENDTLIKTIILFLIVFGIVVISHEFGHYIIGRKSGIRVLEFFVGMGPTLFSFEKGGTKYSLKLFPIGGACMFDGEDGLHGTEDEGKEKKSLHEMAGIESPKEKEEKTPVMIQQEGCAFNEAGVWKRIATVFAGPFFNFLLALVFALIIIAFTGTDRPVVMGFMENSAVEQAGLQVGDVITRIGHERIHLYREVSLISALNEGETLEIHYTRDGEKRVAMVTPVYDEEAGRYYLGLMGAGEYIKCNPIQVFQYSFYEVEYWVKATYKSIGMLLSGQATKDDVSGPVGIAQFVGDTYEEAKGYGVSTVIITMMNIVILLSVNIGIMNLLPLPALDGGRLIFMFVEVIRGKPVPPEKEGIVHFAGLVVLMILMVFVMYNDIMKLVH